MFGIDFTKSNQEATNVNSYHYIYGNELSPYQKAIRTYVCYY